MLSSDEDVMRRRHAATRKKVRFVIDPEPEAENPPVPALPVDPDLTMVD
jgi:hypothetical protein